MERTIRVLAGTYGVIGGAVFWWTGGFAALANFAAGFVLVMLNFFYLESFVRTVIEKDPSRAKWVVLIALVRYPLIALVLYGIVSWRYFQEIPLLFGISAIVFAIMTYPITRGAKRSDAS